MKSEIVSIPNKKRGRPKTVPLVLNLDNPLPPATKDTIREEALQKLRAFNLGAWDVTRIGHHLKAAAILLSYSGDDEKVIEHDQPVEVEEAEVSASALEHFRKEFN